MSSAASTPASTPDAERPWYRQWWAVLLVLPAAVLLLVGLLLFFFISAAVPLPEDIGAQASVVYDVDGQEIGTLNAQEARQDVPLGELPEHVPNAVMAAEDRRFMEHSGISAAGIVRALFTNAKAGEIQQGGSTITQQYIKNAALDPERSFTRKAKEASLALKLEREFDKPEILEMYLNTIYWGRGAYGVEAASRTYFDKSATELTVNESAMLAGMIRSPENLDPRENPEAADQRRVQVLDAMLGEGWIDEAAHAEAVEAGVPETTDRSTVEYGMGAYYLDAVRRELAGEIGENQLYRGLEIHTQMDRRMQEAAEAVMTEQLSGKSYLGALVSIDPRTGGVRALVGGADFAEQQFNSAIRRYRQVGSSFKPFTLAAFVNDGYSPESRFDAPDCIEVEGRGDDGEGHEICNYDQKDHGNVDLYRGTASSLNTVYAQVQEAVGGERVIDTARALGLPNERGDEGTIMEPVPTLTLGVDEFTPLEMASAYGTLAASGVHSDPHLVTRVVDNDGDVVFEAQVEQEEAIPANDAAIVTDVLRSVIEGGTGEAADIGRPVAGKTGTTQDYTNALFVGYVPQLATSVWFGNEDNSPLAEDSDIRTGSDAAAVWGAYMAEAVKDLPVEDFPEPDLSSKDELNGEDEEESPSPTPSPTVTGPTECSEEEGVSSIVLPDGSTSPCPESSPTPSPTPSEEEPSPTPSESEPTIVPTQDPSPSETTSDGGSTESSTEASGDGSDGSTDGSGETAGSSGGTSDGGTTG